ncbi:MAG TPA: PfkB family carbohydrate kinase [Candidatus Limnocylindria bacterium]|jgi:sugar/nucleoside kinase (ribokinase family)|nr:PfkB family carbohydrate kinase [Candidatus Limnocylindria bacterium]
MFDLVAIGHAARDEFEGDPEWRIGGTAVYAAAAAARLGDRVALLTRAGPRERERLAARCAELGVELHALDSETTTTFAFRYVDGKRKLRLKSRARAIGAEAVPAPLRNTRSVVLASIAHELDRSLFEVFADVPRVLAAQGYLRSWDADGSIHRREWDEADDVLGHVAVAVVSEEDIEGDLELARGWARTTPVIVTVAERGAIVLRRGREVLVPGFAVDRVVDPTGAGDAFCAGLALSLADGNDLENAARFANAVASFAVEAVGVAGLATREQVEARMRAHTPSSSASRSPSGGAPPGRTIP